MTEQEYDYYEVLQISPNADMETVHRVFRMMASRLHPDNPQTGSIEKFLLLKRAYDVLSDSGQRARYDASRSEDHAGPIPIFELKDFVFGLELGSGVNRSVGAPERGCGES